MLWCIINRYEPWLHSPPPIKSWIIEISHVSQSHSLPIVGFSSLIFLFTKSLQPLNSPLSPLYSVKTMSVCYEATPGWHKIKSEISSLTPLRSVWSNLVCKTQHCSVLRVKFIRVQWKPWFCTILAFTTFKALVMPRKTVKFYLSINPTFIGSLTLH